MLKILIIDDDELGRELIALHLEGIAECDMAENGFLGVQKFRDSFERGVPYDVILLDIVMPEMDGHTAAMEIRLIEKDWGVTISDGVTIIVLSSLHTPSDVIQSYVAARSAAHLVKPVMPEKLLNTLTKLNILSP